MMASKRHCWEINLFNQGGGISLVRAANLSHAWRKLGLSKDPTLGKIPPDASSISQNRVGHQWPRRLQSRPGSYQCKSGGCGCFGPLGGDWKKCVAMRWLEKQTASPCPESTTLRTHILSVLAVTAISTATRSIPARRYVRTNSKKQTVARTKS